MVKPIVDFAKTAFKIDRAPYDSRIPIGNFSFKKLYGQNYFEQPFKNADLYETQDDVLNAIAIGEIPNSWGATLLRDKFGILGLADKSGKNFEPKFRKMINAYINNNPKIQQKHEDLKFYGGLISSGDKLGSQRITKAAYINRAIDKAMDPEYLSEYGNLPFRIKYMNALKDVVDPKASVYSMAGGTFSSALEQGEKIANARGLKLNFYPPKTVENPATGVTGQYYQKENFVTINDGKVILPKNLFPTDNILKTKQFSSTSEFLKSRKIGERLDTEGGFEYISPLRFQLTGKEGLNFNQIKRNFIENTPNIKNRLNQINNLFEGNKNVIALDHVQPQRFGGGNDVDNLRYIFESGHFGGLSQGVKESDDLAIVVGSGGRSVNKPIVKDKTNFENDIHRMTMSIVDLVKNNKLDDAQSLSDEVFGMVENFKQVNPNIDFKLGIPYVPVKTGEKSIKYIPYHEYANLSPDQTLSLFKNNYIQQYENLPNAGDSIQKSFDKAYEKLAPFIVQGEKLSEIDRKGLMEMKKDGGVVGFAAGGPVPTEPVKPEPTKEANFIQNFTSKLPSLADIKKQFTEGQEYPYQVASNEPIERGFIEDIEKATPEQTIAFAEKLRLQPLDDYIDDARSKTAETIDGQINPNLSYDTQQYLKSRNTADAFRKDFTTLRKQAFACETDPYNPICYLVFPEDGKFDQQSYNKRLNNIILNNPNIDFTDFKLINTLRAATSGLITGTDFSDRQNILGQLEVAKKNFFESDDYKNMVQSYSGAGNFAGAVKEAKKELLVNQIKGLPADTAKLVMEIYQALSAPGFTGYAIKGQGEVRKGEGITRDEMKDYLAKTTSGFDDEQLEKLLDNVLINFDKAESGETIVSGLEGINFIEGTVKDQFGRRVFYPPGSVEGRAPTLLQNAVDYSLTGIGLVTMFGNPNYVSRLTNILKKDDISNISKFIRATPAAIGIPTVQELQGILRLSLTAARKALFAPVVIPFKGAAGMTRYVTATVKPGTENVFVVGNKTLPELGLKLPEEELLKRQGYMQMIANTSRILSEISDQKTTAQMVVDEKNYKKDVEQERLNPQYTDLINFKTKGALRTLLAEPDLVLGTEADLIELQALDDKYDFEKVPAWVDRYAKEQARQYIKQNNLKTNSIGDTLFYDMLNEDEDKNDLDFLELNLNESMKKNKMALGGDPGQFSDPLRLGDDESVDVQSIQQGSPYLGVDELDMFFEDANLKPTDRKEALPPEVQMANVVFGKAPGWAIAGVNKVDNLLRSGNTGNRIAQADNLAEGASTVGEKANRFYSGIEARLIDPNTPNVFAGPEALYDFFQSKGISKFEVEDYQIPQLIETMVKTGKPITKANLLERIKNAPIRKLKSTVRGFRSETENIDGNFNNAKYGDSYYEKGSIPESYRENILYLEAGDIPGDVALYKHSTHGFFPDDSTNYVIGWTRGTDRYAIIPGTKGQVTNIGPKTDELNNKIERLTKITNRSAEDIVNQSGGRVSLEQATTNINKAKKQLAQAQEDLANVGKTDDAIVTGDQTVRVTFADEIQSDIMQTYRKHLENVMNDYKQLVDKGIDIKDTAKIRQEGYRMDLKTDNDVLQFYVKHKSLFRPVFKTEEDFAAYIDDIRKSQAVFKSFAKIKPGEMTQGALAAVKAAGKDRDKVLTMFEEAFTNPETMKKLFPNIPFKDRKVWGDALVKNDLAMAAKRKFVDKDANASDWYVISPAELVANRYGQKGTTATAYAERTKDMKGIGQYEFYGGPNVTDPDGKHFTSILEQSLRRAAKTNNAEFKIVKVQIGEPKSISRSVQITNAQGDVVKEFKMSKSSKAEDFGAVMEKAENYIAETGAEGLMARPVETPSGFKTIDAYAIKLTPEMVLPTKTHLASGGYVRYDPLVSIDEMIGAA